jgi:glycosyl transferase family 25
MELLKNTLYINLDHRQDRLKHVVKELASLGITGERMKATKMENGAVGCTLSHIKCLELAKQREYDHVFICEDDIQFTNVPLLVENLTKFHQHTDIQWDVLIIGGNNCPPYTQISDYCIKVERCQTTTGYIVKKHYYDTLISNFKESVKNLLREPDNKFMYALDKYWQRLQQCGNWYMIIPLTVIQYEDYSDIEKKTVDYKHLMLDLDKTKFIQQQQQLQQQQQQTKPIQFTLSQLNEMSFFIK